ncbi:MAG: SUMF1/EgtB/PvdO family nonheme iron enzyme [Planctomycetes bacterium]|nr:SUMF1/EgtB/PvdO family nonheme iron enzyme [Planctomycetota bacterium]
METSGLDELFAEVAIREQILTPDQVDECRRAVDAALKIGLHASLYEVAVDKDFVTKHEVLNLLSPLIKSGGRPELGNFEIISKIGSGRMGVVYKAEQITLRRLVALRVLPVRFTSDEQLVTAFRDEARRASTLMHRNASALLDIGMSAGLFFMVSQFVEGDNLAEIIRREERLPEKRAVNITTAMADVLQSAHERGILHGDIKPRNIIMTKDGNPMLCDFGLPKQMMLRKVPAVAPEGDLRTASFMSPELDRGDPDIDGRSDIYSLGALFFFMLTGRPPFEGTDGEIRAAREAGPPWPKSIVPGLSKSVCSIIQKSLSAQRERRYKTMDEMLFALRNHARSLPGAVLARMARAVQLQTIVEPQPVEVPGISSTHLPIAPPVPRDLAEETAIDMPLPPESVPVATPVTAAPADAPVPEHVAKRKQKRRLLNAAVLAVGVLLLGAFATWGVVYLRSGEKPSPKPEPVKQAASEKPDTPIPTPPARVIEKSLENEENAKVARRLLDEAHSYAYVHPNEANEVLKKFEAVVAVAPKSEPAAQARRRIEEIKQNLKKEATAEVDKAMAQAEELAKADRFGDAIDTLQKSMKGATPGQQTRLQTARKDLKARAQLRFQEFRASANRLCKSGRFEEAEQALESAKVLGVQAIFLQIEREKRRVEEARRSAQVSALKKAMTAYHKAMRPVLRLAAERSYEEALAECDKLAARPDLALVKPRVLADCDGLRVTQDVYASVCTGGKRLVGKRFTISGISGEIASIKDGIVRLKTGYKKPISSLKLSEILSLDAAGAKTLSAEQHKRRGIFYLYNGDLDAAGPELEAAEARGVDTAGLTEKLRLFKTWKKNELVEDMLQTARDANAQGDWQKAQDILAQMKADYSETDAYVRHRYDVEDLETMIGARADGEAKLVLVPAGKFIYQKDEEREIPAFYIDKYEVSNADYAAFLKYVKRTDDHSFCHPDEPKNKDHTPKDWAKALKERPNCPVVDVDWFDAYAYARFVGKRLPTEEEWERAARGTSGRAFPWGNSKNDSEWVNSSNADGFAGIAPVDSLPAGQSLCGCYHMMGNAEEWTSSWLNEENKSSRVIRGGHYRSPTTLTITQRGGYEPGTRTKFTGFRCAKDAPQGKLQNKEKPNK